jgi:hypothetical protein
MNVKPFPVEFYPKAERDLMNRLVSSKGLNMQHLGLSMLPVYGRIYSDYRSWAYNGAHKVMPNFWTVIVDNPGSAKSATIDAFYHPLSEMNIETEEGVELYTATDTTPEGLSYHLRGKDSGLYLMSDEFVRFLESMGVYRQGNKGYDRSFWLSIFNGKRADILRAGRGYAFVEAQSIGIGCTLQPKILAKIFQGNDIESGMFDRFLWSIQSNGYPDLADDHDRGLDREISDNIQQHIARPRFTTELTFAPDAEKYMREWHEETRLRVNDNQMSPEYQFFGKQVIYANRMALLAEVMHNDSGTMQNISIDSAVRAVALIEWCAKQQMLAHSIAFPESDEMDIKGIDNATMLKFIKEKNPTVTQKQLAEWFNVSAKTIHRWEVQHF